MSLFSVLMTGQAFADSATDFAWHTTGTAPGFTSRTWHSNGENSISLHTCDEPYGFSGRVAMSIHQNHWWRSDS